MTIKQYVIRRRLYSLSLLAGILVSLVSGIAVHGETQHQDTLPQPNILLIVADDMGYSDLGSYGGEISTPALDRLSREGVQFTQFHVTPNCAPTRAALLSGVDHHRAGLGTMAEVITPNQVGKPGYEGHLNTQVVTVAEVLRQAGYHTFISGKWHLGAKDDSMLPYARGFEETFVMLAGGASHWVDNRPLIPGKPSLYARNGKIVENLPEDFYSTTAYTEHMIEFIESSRHDDRPFFGYLAYTAPHNPLHAPKAFIDKYKGKYDGGWDVLRAERLQRLESLGLVPKAMEDIPRQSWTKAWGELSEEQRAERARDMEIYAAMIDYMDESIARLFKYLRSIDEYDDTMIVFLSDNGASKTTLEDYAGIGDGVDDFIDSFDNSLGNRGFPGSYTSIGPGWAYAANTPFRLMKGYMAQGGIQVPCILKQAGSAVRGHGMRIDALTSVIDIVPTVLATAGVEYPEEFQGRPVLPLHGRSLLPLLAGEPDETFAERQHGFELYGMRAFRKGAWKALKLPIPYGSGNWALYHLGDDPAEAKDLADEHPEKVRELAAAWDRYARENGVTEPDQPISYAKAPKDGSY